jgi:hypothetical protein
MVPGVEKNGRPMRRRWIAVALALGAVASIAYGAAVHVRPVMMDTKMALPGASSVEGAPSAQFSPVYNTITFIETEPELVREVTYGGVTRLPTGQTKRTYTGKPPSLCPT